MNRLGARAVLSGVLAGPLLVLAFAPPAGALPFVREIAPPPAEPPPAAAPQSLPSPIVPTPAALPHLSADRQAEARLHYQKGVSFYDEQIYDTAATELQRAYEISSEPKILYTLGLTYNALLRYGDAVDAFSRYLGESQALGEVVSAERRAEVEGLVTEMKSLLADVTIIVQPPDATVRVDGWFATLSGLEGIVKLAAGTHIIEASRPDYATDHRDVAVVAGTPQTVSLTLVAIPHTGHLKVASGQVGAHVAIDGRDLGAAPLDVELGAGSHRLDVTARGFAPNHSELAITAGQSQTVLIPLDVPPVEPEPFYRRWWLWTGVAVAIVAVSAFAFWPRTEGPQYGTLGTPTGDR